MPTCVQFPAGAFAPQPESMPRPDASPRRAGRIPASRPGLDHVTTFFRHPVVQVSVSVLAVLILLISSVGFSGLNAPSSPANPPVRPASQGLPGPQFYPYISSPSMYPSPDLLPNVSGTLSLPQISNLTIGSTYVLALVFVDVIPMEGTILEFDTGEYNASAAEGIAASSSSCILNCTRHLPIVWSQPTPIASFRGFPDPRGRPRRCRELPVRGRLIQQLHPVICIPEGGRSRQLVHCQRTNPDPGRYP